MIEINTSKIGIRIKQLREDFELTQKQLAEKVGIAYNTLSQYESGTAKPSVDVLARLAIALETTADYLLGL